FAGRGGAPFCGSGRLPDPAEAERARQEAEEAERAAEEAARQPSADSPEAIVADVQVEVLQLEIAYDLMDLVDPSRGGDLLDRVKALRRKIAQDLGIVIPLVRTRDNIELPPGTYAIKVHGVELGRGEAPPGHVLVIADDLPAVTDGAGALPAVPASTGVAALPGRATTEPVFGLPARWVPVE